MPLDLSQISNWKSEKFIVKNISDTPISINDLKITIQKDGAIDLLKQNVLTKKPVREFKQIACSRDLELLIELQKVDIYDEFGIIDSDENALKYADTENKYSSRLNKQNIETVADGTTAYVASSADNVILCYGEMSVYFPAAVNNEGKAFHVKNMSEETITLEFNEEETLDEGLTATIENQYECITFISDGNNWFII